MTDAWDWITRTAPAALVLAAWFAFVFFVVRFARRFADRAYRQRHDTRTR